MKEGQPQSISKREFLRLAGLVGTSMLLSACSDLVPTPTLLPTPTLTRRPTRTPTETLTPKPTLRPIETPIPTETPIPHVEIGELRQAGKLIFTTEGKTYLTKALWIMNLDGTEKKLLRETDYYFASIERIGPNKVAVWEATDTYGWHCLVLDSDGKELFDLPRNSYIAPDGKKVLISGERDGDGIYELDLETGQKKKLIQSEEKTRDNSANISPDGRKLVFARYEFEKNFSIYMVDYPRSGESRPVLLTTGVSNSRNEGIIFKWTSDSKNFVYCCGPEIGLVDIEQRIVRKIPLHLKLVRGENQFDISPDSQKLVYSDELPRPSPSHLDLRGIYICRLDGTEQELIYATTPRFNPFIDKVSWIPNMDRIACILDWAINPPTVPLRGPNLYVLDLGTKEIQLVPNSKGIDSYVWLEK